MEENLVGRFPAMFHSISLHSPRVKLAYRLTARSLSEAYAETINHLNAEVETSNEVVLTLFIPLKVDHVCYFHQ